MIYPLLYIININTMSIKLNIINYNPEHENDKKNIQELEEILGELKDNINGKYYLPYKNFLKKMNKFVDMMINTFNKEMDELKKEYDDEENNKEYDNISITSISEYEDDDTYQDENIQIKKLQKQLDLNMSLIKNRFDFEFSKLYE
jgi:hypothetical protein